MPGIGSVSGLVSGIQSDEIIAKIMQFRQRPVSLLSDQRTRLTEQLTAWKAIDASLLAVRMKAGQLSSSTAFQLNTAHSSNESALTATASTTASPGAYTLRVASLATAHQLVSGGGYTSSTSEGVGHGSIVITNVSTGAVKAVNIAEGADSLEAVRDAINASDAGVSAAIINDGSSAPFRLLLTSRTTGTSGEVSIAADLTGGSGLSFDGAASEVTAASDARLEIGSGSSPIVITSASNTIADAIPGVTLRLHSSTPSTFTLDIQTDVEGMKTRVTDFVDAYNTYVDLVREHSSYDVETQAGGPLLGDYGLQTLTADLSSMLTRNVSGLGKGVLSALSGVGIRMGQDGKLSVDDSALQAQLEKDPGAVMRVFARSGTSTEPSISFLTGTSATRESRGAGYLVNITQAATQTRVTAGAAMPDQIEAAEVLTINGRAVTLEAGDTLQQVLSRINEHTAYTGVVASATGADGTGSGNHITLTSTAYGSRANITAVSTLSAVAQSSGFGTVTVTAEAPAGETGAGTGAKGLDVAGTINGEVAEGSGRTLTGLSSNANTAGLAILVNSTSTGDMGYVTYSRGIAAGVSDLVSGLTDMTTGMLATTQAGIQTRIDDLNEQMNGMIDRMALEEERLRGQFAAMEAALSRLQNQSAYLTSSLSGMNNNQK